MLSLIITKQRVSFINLLLFLCCIIIIYLDYIFRLYIFLSKLAINHCNTNVKCNKSFFLSINIYYIIQK